MDVEKQMEAAVLLGFNNKDYCSAEILTKSLQPRGSSLLMWQPE